MRTPEILKMAVAFASLLGSAGVGTAAQHCVNPGGTGGCFATIQAAVDAAVDRDEILIAPGTYVEPHVEIVGKRLSVIGAGAEATVIQSGVVFGNFRRPESSISGVRIDHSDGLEIDGAKVSVKGCVFTGALTGVEVRDNTGTRVTLIDCSLVGNEVGLAMGHSKVRVSRSLIETIGSSTSLYVPKGVDPDGKQAR